jgi:hypothetical protein
MSNSQSPFRSIAFVSSSASIAIETPGSRKRRRTSDDIPSDEPLGSRVSNAVTNGPRAKGELVMIGSGLKAMCHLTREAAVQLRAADVVFAGLDATGPDRRWLELMLRKTVLDLNQFYPLDPTADRAEGYIKVTTPPTTTSILCCPSTHFAMMHRPGRRIGHELPR